MDKGKEILFSAYWNGGRWDYRKPSEEDFALAKAEGYLFDPVEAPSHQETLRLLRETVEKIHPEAVAKAFLYSLSTRELEYRSALGSYYYALAIPDHTHDGSRGCYVCNWHCGLARNDREKAYIGYNRYNFERYKWGGVEHTSPNYALFDLQRFLNLPPKEPTGEDWQILKGILTAMEELPPTKKAGAYRQLITKKKLLKSNKAEVEVLLNILGICGVLAGDSAPCYCDAFADVWQRSPREHTNDYAYPVNHWHVSDGVNKRRFRIVFGRDYDDL